MFLVEIVLNVEREIYTVVEGNYLEVCVVIADGDVAVFPFNVTGHVYCRLHVVIMWSTIIAQTSPQT